MDKTEYTVKTKYDISPLRIAVVSDLHNKAYADVLDACREYKPDCVIVPGDLMALLDAPSDDGKADNTNGYAFLNECVKIAPVFYTTGNHERGMSKENAEKIKKAGATLLINSYVKFKDIYIGGACIPKYIRTHGKFNKNPPPDTEFLKNYALLDGFKLLMCHHPELFEEHIECLDIDLTVSGHAHGGQWRFFGKGVFAPGQGILPKYTEGFHKNRFIISRGLANNTIFPRFFNPRELVFIKLVNQI